MSLGSIFSEIFVYDVRFFVFFKYRDAGDDLVSFCFMSGVVTAFCYSVDHLRQVLKARNTHTPRFQSRVRCDGVHGEHETPVRDLWRPIQRETLRRFRLRGLQGFLQAEKTVKKMIEDCLMLTKKISSKSLCSSSFQADGEKESW